MRIGINTLFIQPGRNRGTFTYLRSLLGELCRIKNASLVLFVTARNERLFDDVVGERILCRIVGGSRAARIIYEQAFLCRRARSIGCDLLFCPGYMAPMFPSIPTVVTVHDMQFRDVPDSLGRAFKLAYNLIVPRAIARAAAVIAVSEFSKRRIIHHLATPAERIWVTHEAALAGTVVPSEEQVKRVRVRYGLKKEYLVSVSTAAPYKNVVQLIEAFLRYSNGLGKGSELVLVGHHSDWFAMKYPDAEANGVKLLGFVPAEDLPSIYRGARAFALASSYEGFGLPVLEAMQFGLPVACSNRASLPEVGGRAALYFDPDMPGAITDAITKVMLDERIRKELRAAIAGNLERFSWEKCGRETYAVFRDVIASRKWELATRRQS